MPQRSQPRAYPNRVSVTSRDGFERKDVKPAKSYLGDTVPRVSRIYAEDVVAQ